MLRKIWLLMMGLISLPAAAELTPQDFHRAVYALQQQQIAQHEIRTAEEAGDYEGAAAARYRYVDTRYYDAANGRLLSRVRRDADTPEHVHIVEVNIYEHGKLVRDFGSLTLPWAPLQPTRTFINLHQYNGKLHSFRQYDFYGDVGYESCEGELGGKARAHSAGRQRPPRCDEHRHSGIQGLLRRHAQRLGKLSDTALSAGDR